MKGGIAPCATGAPPVQSQIRVRTAAAAASHLPSLSGYSHNLFVSLSTRAYLLYTTLTHGLPFRARGLPVLGALIMHARHYLVASGGFALVAAFSGGRDGGWVGQRL